MAKKVIGVDVGTNAVRAAEMTVGGRPQLTRFGQVALPVGAVREGEVVDVAAVSTALQRLWREGGFSGRSVRVGLASARVILRIVDVPELSESETRSTLALQLDEYVPIRIEDTVFDFQPLPQADPESGRRVLLAAAHQDAVRPLVDAVRGAGLRVSAVDVVPSALARAFHDVRPGPTEVDLVVSIGAGTIVVVAARDAMPMFARTITNISGRSITERIAASLAVSDADAERYKRGDVLVGADPSIARTAAAPAVAELVEEIRDSLEFFGAQPIALPVRRVLLTGGGSLLMNLDRVLSERLALPVSFADPFGPDPAVPVGFERSDLPFLAPYVPTAVGIALGGTTRSIRGLDLRPTATRQSGGNRRVPMIVGASASVLLLAGGTLYMQRRGTIADEEARADALALEVVAAQEAALAEAGPNAGDPVSLARSVAESVAPRDVDWLTASQQIEALSVSVGVDLTSIDAVTEPPRPIEPVDPAATAAGSPDGAAPAVATAGGASGPVGAATSTAGAASAAAAATDAATGGADLDGDGVGDPVAGLVLPPVGRATLNGIAADVDVIAAWLDALGTDTRFADAWVTGVTTVTQPDGSTTVQFTAQLTVTDGALVLRPQLQEQPE